MLDLLEHTGSRLMIIIGTISGIIGAVAGIFGSIMGYIAYRRSNELKKSDRRLDLQDITNETQIAVSHLLEILELALRSRRAINSALGMFRSGAMKKYESQHGTDSKRATEFWEQVAERAEDTDYAAMSLQELEKELAEINRIKGEINHLIRRYHGSMQEDKDERHRLHRSSG